MTIRPLVLGGRPSLSAPNVVASALESARAPLVVGAIGAGLVLLAGLPALVLSTSADRVTVGGLSLLGTAAVGATLSIRPRDRVVSSIATVLAIASITALARAVFAEVPTIVWLFAFVVPAVGLVRGPAQGALAGLLAEPALRWIETGTAVGPLDAQAPFGFLILVALGSVPAYLLAVAHSRREALDAQLARANELLSIAVVAREALKEAQDQAIFMLARAAEARDGTTGQHIQSVRALAGELALARGIGAAAAEEIAWSAMLHDLGKLRVPDRVLLKPGSLTEEEWAIIRQHPAWGEELLAGTAGFAVARLIARSHHENWDGTGYPDRLVGEAIPHAARIVRIVDVYDALRSDRPYKPAWSPERALDEIQAMRGRGLDPELTDLFLGLAH
ncbi:MAG: HD domain-containing protein [Chloroflexi bacterium]|nr:HD domain-containing protein [Chloroflexota bacterium]